MAEQVEKPKEPQGTPGEQVPEVTETTPKKEDGPVEGTPSEDFEGRLKEMESALGKYKQELGEEREKVKAYEQWAHSIQQQQKTPQQQPQQPNYEELDKRWYDKPTETFQTLVGQEMLKMQYQTAWQQAPMAKATAKSVNPKAFEGLTDAEVDQAMYGGAQSGSTNPMLLSNPDAWIGAAWILQGKKHGYAIPQAGPGPLNPTPSESPGVPAPGTDTEAPPLRRDSLTDMLINAARKEGMKEEEFLKEVQSDREAEGRE